MSKKISQLSRWLFRQRLHEGLKIITTPTV